MWLYGVCKMVVMVFQVIDLVWLQCCCIPGGSEGVAVVDLVFMVAHRVLLGGGCGVPSVS